MRHHHRRSKRFWALAVAALAILAGAAIAIAVEIPQPALVGLSDLAVEKVQFKLTERTTMADGVTPCQRFNITATIVNRGAKAAQAYQVRVDRKKPNWELACQACMSTLGGLAVYQRRDFGPFSFNNCGTTPAASNEFRVALDPLGHPDAHADNNTMEKTFVPPPLMPKPVPVERKKVNGG